MAVIGLEIYEQNIKLLPLSGFGRSLASEFCRSMIKYKLERVVDTSRPGYHAKMIRVPDCTFAASPLNRSFFSIHIGQRDEFMSYLNRCGVAPEDIEITTMPLYEPAAANLIMYPSWVEKDYQIPIIDYIVSPGTLKILPIQMGKGKTFCALRAAWRMQTRTMLVTKGGYLDKWKMDIIETFDIDKSRVLLIRGTKAMLTAIELAKQGEFDYDFVLISADTYNEYLRQYEQSLGTELGELYTDPRLFGYLFRIGLRIVDEAHQMLHAYYRIDLYSHYTKVVFLSATIIGNDSLERRVHEIIYPASKRYNGLKWDCYINATALRYNLEEPNKARFKDHRKNYSHVIYEQYLMRNKSKLDHYLKMIFNLTNDFICNRLPGQKYMIFASTIDMCNEIISYLKKRMTDISIGRYVGEDNLADIFAYDVIVTTPGSGGTAIDVPDLAAALATPAISSAKQNLQMLGRLRELKNYPGQFPEYQYLVCADIPKHLEYHQQKLDLFAGKVKNHREQSTGVLV